MRAPNARLGAPPTPCRGSATAANDPPAHGHKIYPYLLRNLTIERANHVWVADITYIPIGRGFLCLVAIIHWPSRAVLARPMPIQTNCRTIAVTSAAGAPVMMGWTAPRTASACQDGRCQNPI